MTTRRQLDWVRIVAAFLLSAACAGCAGGGNCHKLRWHHKKACADVVWEFPFYGHYPTCWRAWPADWIGCPPPCVEPPDGLSAESEQEFIPPPPAPDGTLHGSMAH
jgi:hypothetical protein